MVFYTSTNLEYCVATGKRAIIYYGTVVIYLASLFSAYVAANYATLRWLSNRIRALSNTPTGII